MVASEVMTVRVVDKNNKVTRVVNSNVGGSSSASQGSVSGDTHSHSTHGVQSTPTASYGSTTILNPTKEQVVGMTEAAKYSSTSSSTPSMSSTPSAQALVQAEQTGVGIISNRGSPIYAAGNLKGWNGVQSYVRGDMIAPSSFGRSSALQRSDFNQGNEVKEQSNNIKDFSSFSDAWTKFNKKFDKVQTNFVAGTPSKNNKTIKVASDYDTTVLGFDFTKTKNFQQKSTTLKTTPVEALKQLAFKINDFKPKADRAIEGFMNPLGTKTNAKREITQKPTGESLFVRTVAGSVLSAAERTASFIPRNAEFGRLSTSEKINTAVEDAVIVGSFATKLIPAAQSGLRVATSKTPLANSQTFRSFLIPSEQSAIKTGLTNAATTTKVVAGTAGAGLLAWDIGTAKDKKQEIERVAGEGLFISGASNAAAKLGSRFNSWLTEVKTPNLNPTITKQNTKFASEGDKSIKTGDFVKYGDATAKNKLGETYTFKTRGAGDFIQSSKGDQGSLFLKSSELLTKEFSYGGKTYNVASVPQETNVFLNLKSNENGLVNFDGSAKVASQFKKGSWNVKDFAMKGVGKEGVVFRQSSEILPKLDPAQFVNNEISIGASRANLWSLGEKNIKGNTKMFNYLDTPAKAGKQTPFSFTRSIGATARQSMVIGDKTAGVERSFFGSESMPNTFEINKVSLNPKSKTFKINDMMKTSFKSIGASPEYLNAKSVPIQTEGELTSKTVFRNTPAFLINTPTVTKGVFIMPEFNTPMKPIIFGGFSSNSLKGSTSSDFNFKMKVSNPSKSNDATKMFNPTKSGTETYFDNGFKFNQGSRSGSRSAQTTSSAMGQSSMTSQLLIPQIDIPNIPTPSFNAPTIPNTPMIMPTMNFDNPFVSKKKKHIQHKFKNTFNYKPSFAAAALNIHTSKSPSKNKKFTGFELRGIAPIKTKDNSLLKGFKRLF